MPSPNKYKAKKTVVDGITFDSKKEAEYYQKLKTLEKAGIVEHLQLQPRFNIRVNDKFCGFYKADFMFIEYDDNGRSRERIVDVKGMKKGAAWSMFRLKKKLVEALYGIEIEVV